MNVNLESLLAALAGNSVAAGVLVLIILAVQRVFQKQLSPHWRCALWLLVVVRLLPFSFSSDTSIFNLLPRWGTADSAANATGLGVPNQTMLLLNQATSSNSVIPLAGDDATTAIEPVSAEPSPGLLANW